MRQNDLERGDTFQDQVFDYVAELQDLPGMEYVLANGTKRSACDSRRSPSDHR